MDSFIDSLPRLPDSGEMGLWDKAAVEFGIPEIMLMENAGRAAYELAGEKTGSLAGKRVCLFMGGGNNGGDAACMARFLRDAGACATIYSLKPERAISGSPAWHLNLALKNGAAFFRIDPQAFPAAPDLLARMCADNGARPDLLVDALLGTGFHGALRPEPERLIGLVNAMTAMTGIPVLAIDIPSGLNSKTGLPSPVAIQASATITLAAAKPGLLLPHARRFTGELICRPIQIPAALAPACHARWRLLDGQALLHLPHYPANSFKNIYGHVVVVGGAKGYAGAAHLACAGALRSGAGLVSACAPGANLDAIKSGWPEIMTLAAAAGDDWPQTLPEDAVPLLRKADALVIGPGFGRSANAAAFLAAVLGLPDRPRAIVDADALALAGSDRALFSLLAPADILTPHPGEAGALLGCAGSQIQADRPDALDRLCALAPAAIVLKGAGTLIGQGESMRLLSPYDIPQLAVGGAGDVLSGCIGALAASRLHGARNPAAIAGVGVALHAMAALYLARNYPRRGCLASELADALPFAAGFVAAQTKPTAGIMPWPQ